VIDAYIDPAAIVLKIVDAVGCGSPPGRNGKIVDPYPLRLSFWVPFTPSVLKVAHEFFLLGIHRDDWFALRQKAFV